jgi:peptidyl-tRNA hydrolase
MKKEARQHLILQEIAKGTKYTAMVDKFSKEWGLGRTTVEAAIMDALSFMRSEATKENLISMNTERLENIISDSMQEGDNKVAIKAIDTQNKLLGAYEEKVKIDGDSEINLIFDL